MMFFTTIATFAFYFFSAGTIPDVWENEFRQGWDCYSIRNRTLTLKITSTPAALTPMSIN